MIIEQIKPYLEILKRKWWVVVLTALFAFTFSLAVSYNATPQYQTRAQFIISPGPAFLASINDDLSDAVRGIEALDRRSVITTYEEIMNSRQIFERAAAVLNMTSSELDAYEATAVVLPEASSIELTVEGPDAYMTSQLANTLGQESITYIQALYDQLYSVIFLDTAVVPTNPISPQPARDGAVSLVIGLLLGVALAIAADYAQAPLSVAWQKVTIKNRRQTAPEAQAQDASSAHTTQI